MTIAKDWALEAARRIHLVFDLKAHAPQDTSTPRLANIIADCCPFKPDVAYMPVPRCETCANWAPVRDGKTGDCAEIDPEHVILDLPMDFGCVRWEEK